MKPVVHDAQAPTKWVFIGDVTGWDDYHVGDEAMLAANLDLFRSIAHAAELVVVSADPSFTANEYGVRAVARLGFDACTSERQREALLAKLSNPALAAADLPEALAQLTGSSVGLVISGGGNLASAWSNGICERLALCRRATANNAPIIILGQTIGPDLNARDRERVAEILACAAWSGVREAPSFALALELGAPLARMSFQLDDAASLGDGADTPFLPFPSGQRWIAVTFHPLADPAGGDPLIDQLAAQLDRIGSHSGCHLAFIPHAQAAPSIGARWSDEGFGDALARRMQSPLRVMPVMHARDVARVTARAQMVVSSRYHPLVFGLAAGVPCLGVFSTPYTRVKLQGALDHYARAHDLCSIEDVRSGQLAERAALLWDDRAAAARAIAAQAAVNAMDEDRRRNELRRFLTEGVLDDRIQPQRQLRMLATALQQHDGALGQVERARVEAERYALDLKHRLDALTASMVEATAYARSLEQSRDQFEAQAGPVEPKLHTGRRGQDEERTMLSEADWQAFWRDGFIHLGPVLDAQEIRALRDRADALALGQASNPAIQMQRDTGGDYDALPVALAQSGEGTHLYRKIQGLETDDLFDTLIHKPLFREICAQMYGAHADISIFRAMVMNKPAGQGTLLPWHQDGGTVWQLDRDPLVTIWVALDAATTANGCMEAVRGSHRLGLLSAHGSTLSEDDVLRHCVPENIVPLEVPAGHAIFLHNWLIHRSGVNPSSTPRRAFTMCCMDARTRAILTGDHFPIIHGSAPESAYPFVRHLQQERAAYREAAAEAEKYALSLKDHNEQLRNSITEADRHAPNPEHTARLRHGGLDLDDLREENRRLIAAVTQMRAEILTLNRALDTTTWHEPETAAPVLVTEPAVSEEVVLLRAQVEDALLFRARAEEALLLLRIQAEDLSRRLQAMHDSYSWRITRPLRKLASALRILD